MRSRLVCAGCGTVVEPDEPYPFLCPNAGTGDVDHVLRRELELGEVAWPLDHDPNPFVRYRGLLHAHGLGLPDAAFVELVRRLDREVARVDGHGFAETPFGRADALSERLGFSDRGGVFVKDETGNVSGSHKARHLFGVLVWLEAAEQLGLAHDRPDLAIASCGNAALAAAVVAAAGKRRLQVFVPPDANGTVLARLDALGAHVEVCERRPGVAGDPTYHRLLEAITHGALPFTCQGNLNGLAVEGGETLAWEIAAAGVDLDRVVVQVGGGALASAVAAGFREAEALAAIPRAPRLDTVQTEGCSPLERAYDLVAGRGVTLRTAATHRSEFMWPWEAEPHSVAHGILDDETYDWVAVVEGMLATGGTPVVVGEEVLRAANALARETTGIDVDHTGSSGLAGLMALRAAGEVGDDEKVALLFTGVVRTHATTERTDDEELRRTRHPVAEGLRAR